MSWPFLAVVFSGWLYVDAAYRGPSWQRWVFKPITLLLLLFWTWQSPDLSLYGYLILFGLLASLIADLTLMIPNDRLLYTVGALFVSHLLYTISFANLLSFSFFWPIPLILISIGAIVMTAIWGQLNEQRWSIATFVAMTLIMVWVAAESYIQHASDIRFSQLIGAILLLIAHAIWLISHYRMPFRASSAVIAASYFLGHFMVVRSLHLL